MPTYKYRCDACGAAFTQFQNIHEDPVSICPECAEPVKRIITGGAGVIIRGAAGPRSRTDGDCCGSRTPCSDPKRCCWK